jgi:hypothetical protein
MGLNNKVLQFSLIDLKLPISAIVPLQLFVIFYKLTFKVKKQTFIADDSSLILCPVMGEEYN